MSREPGKGDSRKGPAEAEPVDAARFVRGLTIGLIVGAVIAGSTLWRRLGSARNRS